MLYITVIAFLSGAAASMGLGGGTVLILFLTLSEGMSQRAAQGINLVFFIPAAVLSLIFHSKNGFIEWKKIIPAIIAGTLTACICAGAANTISQGMSRKLFGAFILFMGMRSLAQTQRRRVSPASG